MEEMNAFGGIKSATELKDFRRKFVVDLNTFMSSDYYFAALIGPRKCGKTYALNQLCYDYPNSVYIDCKTLEEKELLSLYDTVIDLDGNYDLIVIDEITYAKFPDCFIAKLAHHKDTMQSKLIITGSQPLAIENWVDSSFAVKCLKIFVSFLDFDEWLLYSGRIEEYGGVYHSTFDDFGNYLMNSIEFYGMKDNRAYLQGCINETIISNNNAVNYIPGDVLISKNETDNVIAFLYVNLLKLHNHVKWETMLDSERLAAMVWYGMSPNEIKQKDFYERFENSYKILWTKFNKISLDRLQQYLRFLIQIDFITITAINDDGSTLQKWIWELGPSPIGSVTEFCKKYVIQVKYPMFYFNFVKECFCYDGIKLQDFRTNMVLGSALECYVRGLISYQMSSFVMEEYSFANGEVDYIDRYNHKALEISVANKTINEVYFSSLPDFEKYRCTLLTADVRAEYNNVKLIPFNDYVYEQAKKKRINGFPT